MLLNLFLLPKDSVDKFRQKLYKCPHPSCEYGINVTKIVLSLLTKHRPPSTSKQPVFRANEEKCSCQRNVRVCVWGFGWSWGGGASAMCSGNAGAKGIGKGHGVAHCIPRGLRGQAEGSGSAVHAGDETPTPALQGERAWSHQGLMASWLLMTSPPRQNGVDIRVPKVLLGCSQREVSRCWISPDPSSPWDGILSLARHVPRAGNAVSALPKRSTDVFSWTSGFLFGELSCFNPDDPR